MFNFKKAFSRLGDKINKRGKEIEKRTNKEIYNVYKRRAYMIHADAVKDAPKDLGNLSQSINVFDESNNNQIKFLVIANAPYAAAIEYGTKPFFPPVKELEGWAQRVLGDKKLAFVVARSISKKGIKPNPYMMPAYHKHAPKLEKDVQAALKKGVK